MKPAGGHLADLERRFEDRDEPLSAIQPVLEQTLAEEREELIRLAINAEFDGKVPPTVFAWLAEEGIEL